MSTEEEMAKKLVMYQRLIKQLNDKIASDVNTSLILFQHDGKFINFSYSYRKCFFLQREIIFYSRL